MKEIYIVLTKSKTILSQMISLFSSAQYTHSSISFDSDIDEMYSMGRIYTFLTLPAHMKKEKLDEGFYHYYKNTKIGIFSISVSDASYSKMKEYVEKQYLQNKKLRYSILGLFFYRLNIGIKRKNKMYCSEFVCNVLKQADEDLISLSPELCSPTDLLSINGLKEQYVGTVSELIKLKG